MRIIPFLAVLLAVEVAYPQSARMVDANEISNVENIYVNNKLADMDTKLKCSSRFREVETPVTALVLWHESGYLAANEENKALLCVKPDHGQETCEVWPHSAEEMEELREGLKRSDREADQRAYACLARYAVSEREKIPYEAVSQEEIQSAETQEWEIDTEAPSL